MGTKAIQWYADLGLVHRVMPIVLWDKVDALSRIPTDAFALQKAAMVMGGTAARGGDIIRQFIKVERAARRNPEAITHLAAPWLASGAELALGTNDPAHIDLVEVTLT